VAWLLLCEAAVIIYVTLKTATHGWPAIQEWVTFAMLAVATGVYMRLTWPTETRNRAARLGREHIDHTGIFTVAAAWALPISLMVVLVVGIRVARYLIARKPPARLIFGTAGILASCIAAHEMLRLVAPVDHAPGTGGLIDQAARVLVGIVAVVPAAVAYYAAQTVLIGVARGLGGDWHWRNTIGTKNENKDLVCTIGMGVVAAYFTSPGEAILLVAVVYAAVVYTHSTQGEADGRHDTLTDLLLRGAFRDAADQVLKNDERAGRPTAFVIIDVDYFKKINDTYSHAAGDAVLKAVAAVLKEHSRSGLDVLGRWGGEEFTILLPGTDAESAARIANRMRLAVKEVEVDYTPDDLPSQPVDLRWHSRWSRWLIHLGWTWSHWSPLSWIERRRAEARSINTRTAERSSGQAAELTEPAKVTVARITFSAGLAVSSDHGYNLDKLYIRADEALYQSKQGGRDRVTVSPRGRTTMATATLHATEAIREAVSGQRRG
jgi:diguanylate cyclase (GGDEF)-like protein